MKILVFLFPITLFLIFLCIKLFSPNAYMSFIQEDSVIEYAQALFYFLSSILSFYVSVKFLRNRLTLHGILYSMLAAGLLFVSIEEISWGQRILNIATPAYCKLHNAQREISLHNLDVIQPKIHSIYILVGAYGSFLWIFVSLFLPKSKTDTKHIVNFVVPDWFISPYFFFTFFIYTIFEYISRPYPGGFLACRDQEPAELLLSFGFFSFVVTNYIRLQLFLKRRATQPGNVRQRGQNYNRKNRA
ncbi:MAG: hypothetical protein JW787_14055 [Sedimentisphaerales bacterium]|nr:hypothetical protein [Sedimentisphaerales bacterium]